MFPDDPNVQIALIGLIGSVLLAAFGLFADYVRRKLTLVEGHAAEAAEQVKNSHSTNLRDDLDDLHSDVRQVLHVLAEHGDDLRQHASEIGGLRSDMRIERQERLALQSRVDAPLVHITAPAAATISPEGRT